MNTIESLQNQTVITRNELLQLWNTLEQERVNRAVNACVKCIKKDVVEGASKSKTGVVWMNTRDLIASCFTLNVSEVTDSLADEVTVMIIQKLREIFPDCDVQRVVGRTMYGVVINDAIKVSWV